MSQIMGKPKGIRRNDDGVRKLTIELPPDVDRIALIAIEDATVLKISPFVDGETLVKGVTLEDIHRELGEIKRLVMIKGGE